MAKDFVYVHHRPIELKAFHSPTGMVGSWTKEQGHKVATHARLGAPKPGQGKGYATGELASDIRVNGPTMGRKGPEVEVVADTEHAAVVHEPTPPHIIKPRYAKKLVFFWRKAGRVVFMDKVRHPGTKGNPFLANALKKVFGGPGR